MKRISLKQLGVVALSGLAAASCSSGEEKDKQESPQLPNIIFIMADDLGYNDLGCYGQKLIQTPNIDNLAAEGMRFTQCYAGSTVSAPSRSVLMTGMHTGHTTVRGNFSQVDGLVKDNRVPLKNDDVTVAEVLKKAGYVTGITGKWGIGEPGTTGIPNNQGFDEWFGYLNQRNAHSYYPTYLWKNQQKFLLEGNEDGKRETYTHNLMTGFALDFLQRHKDTTFFLYVPYTIPHSKYEIPSIEPYQDKDWSEKEKIYAAMVTLMDSDVGKMIDSLKKYDIHKNTLVFFCSDNGAAEFWEGRFNSSGKLRGRKRDMYEGGIRVPMVAWQPGTVPAGVVNDNVWYFADVLPTFADIASVEAPRNVDGISILPVLKGEDMETSDRFLYWEFFERGYQQAVRWKNWKAIRMAPGQDLELYNLETDPAEQNNVAEENPEIVQEIEEYLKTARTESEYWLVENAMKE